LFTSPTGVKNTIGRVTTQQFPSVGFDALEYTKPMDNKFGTDPTSTSGKFTFSDFLNLFLFSEKYDLGAMIKALQVKGLFQSLAEPNLVAESGKEASFLAGGEFPIPIAQASGGGTSISVIFKEFGIRLSFTPIVIGNRVHLKVKPEVSSLDFTNAITLGGFRIPALSTRRTETEVELNDGQTFAIAGLMNNTMNTTMQKIPGIGDIPILGLLFKSKAAQKNQTELVVMITPHILQRQSPGVTPNLPRMPETFMPPVAPNRSHEVPPPAFGRQGAAGQVYVAPADEPAADQNPTSAADKMRGLTPSRPVTHVPEAKKSTQPTKATATPATQAAKPVKEDERAREAAARAAAKQQEIDRRNQKIEQEKQARLAKEQARKDAEAARVAAEEGKRQAELARQRQKALDEAAALAKAAEARYQAELAKKQQR
jgi:hypothetical protein